MKDRTQNKSISFLFLIHKPEELTSVWGIQLWVAGRDVWSCIVSCVAAGGRFGVLCVIGCVYEWLVRLWGSARGVSRVSTAWCRESSVGGGNCALHEDVRGVCPCGSWFSTPCALRVCLNLKGAGECSTCCALCASYALCVLRGAKPRLCKTKQKTHNAQRLPQKDWLESGTNPVVNGIRTIASPRTADTDPLGDQKKIKQTKTPPKPTNHASLPQTGRKGLAPSRTLLKGAGSLLSRPTKRSSPGHWAQPPQSPSPTRNSQWAKIRRPIWGGGDFSRLEIISAGAERAIN